MVKICTHRHASYKSICHRKHARALDLYVYIVHVQYTLFWKPNRVHVHSFKSYLCCTHTHTSLLHTLICTHTCTLTHITLTHTHIHVHSPLTHTHTHTHTLTYTHFHTHTGLPDAAVISPASASWAPAGPPVGPPWSSCLPETETAVQRQYHRSGSLSSRAEVQHDTWGTGGDQGQGGHSS